jgi:hypothetical protein
VPERAVETCGAERPARRLEHEGGAEIHAAPVARVVEGVRGLARGGRRTAAQGEQAVCLERVERESG